MTTRRIRIRRATSRTGKVGYIADLIDSRPGSPVFPIVPFVLTMDELDADIALHGYLRRHPETTVEMAG